LKIPLWCHAQTAARLGVAPDRSLVDGEVLVLEGEPEQRWRVLHTPGHAKGHLCLIDGRSRAAVVGDMAAGVGTIVIDPAEGPMATVLAALGRLRDLPVGPVYPAHGPPIPDGPAKMREYLAHRAHREELILGALGAVGGPPVPLARVVERAYADTPVFIHP